MNTLIREAVAQQMVRETFPGAYYVRVTDTGLYEVRSGVQNDFVVLGTNWTTAVQNIDAAREQIREK